MNMNKFIAAFIAFLGVTALVTVAVIAVERFSSESPSKRDVATVNLTLENNPNDGQEKPTAIKIYYGNVNSRTNHYLANPNTSSITISNLEVGVCFIQVASMVGDVEIPPKEKVTFEIVPRKSNVSRIRNIKVEQLPEISVIELKIPLSIQNGGQSVIQK